MFKGIKSGWELITESVKIFRAYPVFVLPMIGTWLIFVPVILYIKYGLGVNSLTFGTLFIVIVFFSFLLAFSCTILLNLIEQHETGQKIVLSKAFFSSLGKVINIIPLVLIWATMWFVITLISAIFRKKEKEGSESLSMENAAKTLGGSGGFSFSAAFFDALNKGIRMVVFLILPAIVWEKMNFSKAYRKGFSIFRAHLSEFTTGFLLTEGIGIIIFLPVGVIFVLSDEAMMVFPDFVWLLTIIYIAFAWSYMLYMEQMFTALLYLWHLKWQKEVERLQKEGVQTLPSMRDIPQPSLLDENYDLISNKIGSEQITPKINPENKLI